MWQAQIRAMIYAQMHMPGIPISLIAWGKGLLELAEFVPIVVLVMSTVSLSAFREFTDLSWGDLHTRSRALNTGLSRQNSRRILIARGIAGLPLAIIQLMLTWGIYAFLFWRVYEAKSAVDVTS